jgi:cell division protein FtsB
MNRKKRRPAHEYLFIGLLAILFVWLVYALFGIVGKEERARKTAGEAKEELEALAERHATLERNLADLETPRGLEASYREQFGVARPGEEVIIVVTPPQEEPQSGLSWWRRWLGYVGL